MFGAWKKTSSLTAAKIHTAGSRKAEGGDEEIKNVESHIPKSWGRVGCVFWWRCTSSLKTQYVFKALYTYPAEWGRTGFPDLRGRSLFCSHLGGESCGWWFLHTAFSYRSIVHDLCTQKRGRLCHPHGPGALGGLGMAMIISTNTLRSSSPPTGCLNSNLSLTKLPLVCELVQINLELNSTPQLRTRNRYWWQK